MSFDTFKIAERADGRSFKVVTDGTDLIQRVAQLKSILLASTTVNISSAGASPVEFDNVFLEPFSKIVLLYKRIDGDAPLGGTHGTAEDFSLTEGQYKIHAKVSGDEILVKKGNLPISFYGEGDAYTHTAKWSGAFVIDSGSLGFLGQSAKLRLNFNNSANDFDVNFNLYIYGVV